MEKLKIDLKFNVMLEEESTFSRSRLLQYSYKNTQRQHNNIFKSQKKKVMYLKVMNVKIMLLCLKNIPLIYLASKYLKLILYMMMIAPKSSFFILASNTCEVKEKRINGKNFSNKEYAKIVKSIRDASFSAYKEDLGIKLKHNKNKTVLFCVPFSEVGFFIDGFKNVFLQNADLGKKSGKFFRSIGKVIDFFGNLRIIVQNRSISNYSEDNQEFMGHISTLENCDYVHSVKFGELKFQMEKLGLNVSLKKNPISKNPEILIYDKKFTNDETFCCITNYKNRCFYITDQFAQLFEFIKKTIVFYIVIHTDIKLTKTLSLIFNYCIADFDFVNIDKNHFFEMIKRFLNGELKLQNKDSLQYILNYIKKIDEEDEAYKKFIFEYDQAYQIIKKLAFDFLSNNMERNIDFGVLLSVLALINVKNDKSSFSMFLKSFVDCLDEKFSSHITEKIDFQLLFRMKIADNINIILENCELECEFNNILKLQLNEVFPDPYVFIKLCGLLSSPISNDQNRFKECIIPLIKGFRKHLKNSKRYFDSYFNFLSVKTITLILKCICKLNCLKNVENVSSEIKDSKYIQFYFSANKELVEKIFNDLQSKFKFDFAKENYVGWTNLKESSSKIIIYRDWYDEIIQTEKIVIESHLSDPSRFLEYENITYIQYIVLTSQIISNIEPHNVVNISNPQTCFTFPYQMNLYLEQNGVRRYNGGLFVKNFGESIELIFRLNKTLIKIQNYKMYVELKIQKHKTPVRGRFISRTSFFRNNLPWYCIQSSELKQTDSFLSFKFIQGFVYSLAFFTVNQDHYVIKALLEEEKNIMSFIEYYKELDSIDDDFFGFLHPDSSLDFHSKINFINSTIKAIKFKNFSCIQKYKKYRYSDNPCKI
ncbi:hypothetical protein EDEG_00911 [Edhazardia aedis USNM 41457]|uniref:Uncharacterized protein n=1 Tax=Edhazardia aedis (strain USNM 41457) TaxID=1003232 RepID=J9DBX5_EDHAE|nr:hypothetical protein EDEG_00911 [Edhazardia aedis USNM 41457]|eukprot:EJW04994.1 hypothetical protein EDEG_00911 [Edhazardia aedis USNM 41457]